MYDRMTKSADIVQSEIPVAGRGGGRGSLGSEPAKVVRVTESVLLVPAATLILMALGELGVRIAN
jgi:hypothetical protein